MFSNLGMGFSLSFVEGEEIGFVMVFDELIRFCNEFGVGLEELWEVEFSLVENSIYIVVVVEV